MDNQIINYIHKVKINMKLEFKVSSLGKCINFLWNYREFRNSSFLYNFALTKASTLRVISESTLSGASKMAEKFYSIGARMVLKLSWNPFRGLIGVSMARCQWYQTFFIVSDARNN
jgi:hypothetical protein